MLKKSMALLVSAFLLLSTAGCAAKGSGGAQSTETAGRDYTVNVAFSDYSKNKINKEYSVKSEGCFLFSGETYAELEKHSTQIAAVTINSVNNYVKNASAFTVMNATVDEKIKGVFSKGDKITVCQGGGYVTMKEIIDNEIKTNGDAGRFSKVNESEMSTVIEMQDNGYSYPKAGEKYVYFMLESNIIDGAYMPFDGYYGTYKLNSDGEYARTLPSEGKRTKAYKAFKLDDNFKNKIKNITATRLNAQADSSKNS